MRWFEKILLKANKYSLFIYLFTLIGTGALLLMLPFSSVPDGGIRFIDALFISTSAVCVTGLSTLPISIFTPFGKFVILLLVQFGGLGIITFASVYLTVMADHMSISHTKMIKEYFLMSVEFDTKKITESIIVSTLLIELVGAILLIPAFKNSDAPIFYAMFHSISSFCNAGFALYDDSLASFSDNYYLLIVITVIYILGGLGFVVYSDIFNRIKLYFNKTKSTYKVSLHTKIVIYVTLILLATGTLCFYYFERNNTFKDFTTAGKWVNAFFQSATTRTAGFNVVDQAKLSEPSFFVTVFLMFIGGAPGSIAGGLKVTTFFVVFMSFIRGFSSINNLSLWYGRSISKDIVSKAFVIFTRGIAIFMISVFLLSITEFGKNYLFADIVYEVVSSISTVGLTRGITGNLTDAGKWVIIVTMFAGRVGLTSILMPLADERKPKYYYPPEEILL